MQQRAVSWKHSVILSPRSGRELGQSSQSDDVVAIIRNDRLVSLLDLPHPVVLGLPPRLLSGSGEVGGALLDPTLDPLRCEIAELHSPSLSVGQVEKRWIHSDGDYPLPG